MACHRAAQAALPYQSAEPLLVLVQTDDFSRFPAAEAHALHRLGAGIEAEPAGVSLERRTNVRGLVSLRPRRCSRELRRLYKALRDAMVAKNLLRAHWVFSPQLPLGFRLGKVEVGPIVPIAWESHEFVLVHDEAGCGERRVLGRWPLRWRQGRLF